MKTFRKSTWVMFGLIAFMSCIFASCGNSGHSSGITVVGSDSTVYESYEDACHAQDFDAAHKFLTAMKKAGYSDYDDAREYVFNQEALYLIAMNDETSTKRLFFLLQEDANEVSNSVRDARCNTIVELAIKQNNQALVEQTAGMYNGQIEFPVLQKIYNYIYKEGRNEDKTSMMDLLFKNNGIEIMADDAISNQDDALLMQIIAKCNDKNLDVSKKIIRYFTVKKDRKQIASLSAILRKNMQWDALMELAVTTNDVALMKQCYQKAENKDELFKSMVQHAIENKSASEMQGLLPLVTNSSYAQDVIEKSMDADFPNVVTTLTKKYGTQFSESFLDDIMKYAISKNGGEFTNLVISILNSTEIEGRPLPAGQRMTSDRPADVVSSHNLYVSSVKSFNSKCDEVLSSAISQHKSQLANKVVTLYKDVPNDYVVNEHWWQIAKTCTYSKDDKIRAQERIKEAKRRGDI